MLHVLFSCYKKLIVKHVFFYVYAYIYYKLPPVSVSVLVQ